jgi:hypothetical protein
MSEPYSQGLQWFEKDQPEAGMLVISRVHAAVQHVSYLAEFGLVADGRGGGVRGGRVLFHLQQVSPLRPSCIATDGST